MIESKEWERRYKARIVEVLKGTGWTEEMTEVQAIAMAQAEYDAAEPTYLRDSFEDDPEGSADESMSYWDNDTGEAPWP